MNVMKTLMIVSMTANLFGLVGGTDARGQAPNPDLVGKLTKELKVTPEQATGGAGAIFSLAKSRFESGRLLQSSCIRARNGRVPQSRTRRKRGISAGFSCIHRAGRDSRPCFARWFLQIAGAFSCCGW